MSTGQPDGFRIDAVAVSAAPVLANLFEHYMHDMAEWFEFDTEANGAYQYPAHKCWDNGGVVYLAYLGQVPVGFAIVVPAESPVETSTVDLKEFFVVRRHRRHRLGQALATHVWDRHPGPWLVRVFRGNPPALPFWRQCVDEYSQGQFQERERQANGRTWSYFTFRSPGGTPQGGQGK